MEIDRVSPAIESKPTEIDDEEGGEVDDEEDNGKKDDDEGEDEDEAMDERSIEVTGASSSEFHFE